MYSRRSPLPNRQVSGRTGNLHGLALFASSDAGTKATVPQSHDRLQSAALRSSRGSGCGYNAASDRKLTTGKYYRAAMLKRYMIARFHWVTLRSLSDEKPFEVILSIRTF